MKSIKKIKQKIKKTIFGFCNSKGYKVIPITVNDIALYNKLFDKESITNRKFYNISGGAFLNFGGGFQHPCWINIDLEQIWKNGKYITRDSYNPVRDIAHDLLTLKPIPVENSCAELVHSRFVIAAITDKAAQVMFNEAHRILKKGGIFRVATLNIDLDYRAYINNDMSYFSWFRNNPLVSIEQAFLYHVAAQLSILHPNGTTEKITDAEFRELLKTKSLEDALNYCTSKCSVEIQKKFRSDHINWWNPVKLKRMLTEAGFKTVYLSSREQSASPVMRNTVYFDNKAHKTVMYMEAVKK